MVKETVKGASGLLLCWIGLMAVVCVPSFIAGIAYTKPAGPITLVNATVTGSESGVLSLSNAANLNPAPDCSDLAQYEIDSPSVLDGTAAASGRL
ncbi:MAG: hypothetical protein ISS70_01060 [Phycisphaerae bacterium]|nr:hypothetical protein [Phycisphaerae bacterium]